ncbi:hypothetical protein GGR28_000005 [Lewinella aquimaris]|uniref:Secretion system C-terminal sorting domain-containing protein n=1 Tax=Neolewinella aquimaris TaxID=1835722 RepID=A0A840DW55_9BACT|nr:hypothetical protein [Neolewinella aquimaris]MBB4077404.1 hypothetical protein [Neolewinella aquimaris]
MKTILFTLLFLTAAATLPASVNPSDLIVRADPASHTLILRTTTGIETPTTLKIVDAGGLVLHSSKLEAGDYLSQRFNLDALPTGAYSVVISDVLSSTVQPIVITAEGVHADAALATRTFFPQVNLKDKLLTVNYLNATGHSVSIRLSDGFGNEVIADRLPGTTSVQRAYSLENLPAGEYFVTVNSADVKNHTTSISLN